MEEKNSEKSIFEIVKQGSPAYNLKYQIIIIGDECVGKTCICEKHTKNIFVNEYNQTKAYNTFDSHINYKDIAIKLQIFDTSGEDKYNQLILELYKKTSLAIIVYSIDE